MRREIKATIVGVESVDGGGSVIELAKGIDGDVIGLDATGLTLGGEVLLTVGTGGRTLCDVLLEQAQDEAEALRAKVAELEADLVALGRHLERNDRDGREEGDDAA